MDDSTSPDRSIKTSSPASDRAAKNGQLTTGFSGRLTAAAEPENELQELGHYYLETDEFHRAARGEVRVVAGRKGAGKTALFVQLRNKLRSDRSRVILDLKPEGFQLLKFKERVLDYLEGGTREHTITAFWEYLLLLEICHKILENDRLSHVRDTRLYEPYRRLADQYDQDDFVAEGDFAERMLKLTERIADDFAASYESEDKARLLTSGQITELLYKHDVASLRRDLILYLEYKKDVWILFDNLDRGWPPYGVQPEDVLNLRTLIDAMMKIERELRKQQIECHCLVFIRNDVYELLVANTSDRGKVSSVTMDWTDAELLRELLRRRFVYGIDSDLAFEEIWRQISVSHIKGEETSQYLIDRSLMRPRELIELIRFCRSHAVNLRHQRVEEEDILQGEESYSTQLLRNIGYEIKDVLPAAGEVLYEFIESPVVISGDEIRSVLTKVVGGDNWPQLFELLLWYGFLGLLRDDQEATYIYNVKYDLRRLMARVEKKGIEQSAFRINPAFWRALEVHN